VSIRVHQWLKKSSAAARPAREQRPKRRLGFHPQVDSDPIKIRVNPRSSVVEKVVSGGQTGAGVARQRMLGFHPQVDSDPIEIRVNPRSSVVEKVVSGGQTGAGVARQRMLGFHPQVDGDPIEIRVNPRSSVVEKVVSGGQTGADRAALDWAIENGIPHGGWCPKGRLAEDAPIPAQYHLTETPSSEYTQRTEWNVRDSDGTVVFSIAPKLTGGSKETVAFAQKHGKPAIQISRQTDNPAEALLRFIHENGIRVLNVAGPRASEEPGVDAFVRGALDAAMRLCRAS
jgi:hypothetical protein